MEIRFAYAALGFALVAASCDLGEPLFVNEHVAGVRSKSTNTYVAVNAYYLQEEAARAARKQEEPLRVLEVLDKVSALGVGLIRTNAHNDDPDKAGASAIQTAPSVYDEVGLEGLDVVLAESSRRGIRLILTLSNYWDAYGGAAQYVRWVGQPGAQTGDSRFFTNAAARALFKEYVTMLLTRINSVDGIRYGEHPAVFAWELINEPRGEELCRSGEDVRDWVDDMAAHVRMHSENQWVGTGEEGFDHKGSELGASFPSVHRRVGDFGTSFALNTASAYVDFASVHVYPEAWGVSKSNVREWGCDWIRAHAKVAADYGKPLIVGEFGLKNRGGLSLAERRSIYRDWFQCAFEVGASAIAPWMFSYDSRPDEWDDFTFYSKSGAPLDSADNRYADIVAWAASAQRFLP